MGPGNSRARSQRYVVFETQAYQLTQTSGLQDGIAGSRSPTIPMIQSFMLDGTPGTEYIFGGWNDGGAQTHTITVNAAPRTLTASYGALYLLSLAVYPPSAGTITIGGAPVSGTLTNSPGATVTVTATANSPYSFISWGGIPSGAGNPATITMNGPVNLTADFGPSGFTCSLSGKAVVSVSDVQGVINQALGIAPASNDFNQDGSVTVADVQRVLNAAMNLGCLY